MAYKSWRIIIKILTTKTLKHNTIPFQIDELSLLDVSEYGKRRKRRRWLACGFGNNIDLKWTNLAELSVFSCTENAQKPSATLR